MHAAKFLTDGSLLLSHFGMRYGDYLMLLPRPRGCRQYATNGFSPVAAHLLFTDVQRFEHLARKSWSAIIPLRFMSRFSPIMLPRPLSQPPQQLSYTPLPPAPLSIVNLCVAPHRLCVISGWTALWIMATAPSLCQSASISNRQSGTLHLCVWQRERGVAGVRRVTGYDPSVPRPPGTREHISMGIRLCIATQSTTDELWR
jgi:hypothetical protein